MSAIILDRDLQEALVEAFKKDCEASVRRQGDHDSATLQQRQDWNAHAKAIEAVAARQAAALERIADTFELALSISNSNRMGG